MLLAHLLLYMDYGIPACTVDSFVDFAEARARARSHCQFALLLIHFISDYLTHSVPLYLMRPSKWDQTLPAPRAGSPACAYASPGFLPHGRRAPQVSYLCMEAPFPRPNSRTVDGAPLPRLHAKAQVGFGRIVIS
jgi:hypothetical protein